MNKIVVSGAWEAQNKVFDECWAVIQISTFGDWPRLNKCKQIDCIQLAFVDVNRSKLERIKDTPLYGSLDVNWRLFNKEFANKIFDFIELNKNKIDVLFVHCEAGVSRSPAIAAAIDKIYLKNDNKIWFKNYRPNDLVYDLMLEVASERGM